MNNLFKKNIRGAREIGTINNTTLTTFRQTSKAT